MSVTSSIIQSVAGGVTERSSSILPFVSTWETTTASESITIPGGDLGTYDATIDWGDGSALSTITTFNDADLTHVYAVAGLYDISISGTFPWFLMDNTGDKTKIKDIKSWGSIGSLSLARSFYGCTSLTGTSATDTPDWREVSSCNQCFRDCSLFNGAFGTPNTAKVTNTAFMFFGCSVFNQPVAFFDLDSCTDSNAMFFNCSLFNQPLGTWNTENNQSFANMLNNCDAFDQDLSSLNIEKLLSLTGFMSLTPGLSTSNYDSLLIAWEAQNVKPSLTADFGNAFYSAGAPATARANLIANDLWTINDGGPV